VLQLQILTGKMAGAQWAARHFPVRIGRAPDADLSLEEEGVWDFHLEINADPARGLVLSLQPGAFASINSRPVEQAVLRNGDLIELGAVKLQFGLSPTRHRSLRLREVLTWIALALLCLGQVALIYWLPG
jgi:pSer/pThr/pTyr-binding forkhead associated (FHA) protein